MTTADFIALHRNADVRQLALTKPPADIDLAFALRQIEGWQTARRKLPSWAARPDIVYPPRLALEQCSSEATAAYKRQVLQASIAAAGGTPSAWSLADLTGGMGVDFAAMAPIFATATYVERQPHLLEAARHNIGLLMPQASATRLHFVCAEAETWLTHDGPDAPTSAVIYLDPARRDSAGRKVTLIEDCLPDVCALHEAIMSRCRLCLVKLSPMLDISVAMRSLPATTDIHVVSLNGECKEILFVLAPATGRPATIHCAMLTQTAAATDGPSAAATGSPAAAAPPQLRTLDFTPADEAAAPLLTADGPGAYIYEPDAAILKAGAFKLVCQHWPVRKLAANTHLYTADSHIADFPGRAWHLAGRSSFNKRELKSFLAGVATAELGVRGFPATAAALRQRLRLPDGPGAHLIATTLADGSHTLLRVEPLNGLSTLRD